jgi:chlorophyll synthase
MMIRHLPKLVLNHADAWGVASMISAAAVGLHGAWSPRAVTLIAAVAAATLLGFALNDYADAAHDALDPRKQRRNFFVAVRISRRVFVRCAALIGMVAPVMAYAAFGWRGVAVLMMGGWAAWAYSAPPLRLKSRPFFDLITHAAFVQTFPYTATLYLLGLSVTPTDRALLACFVLASLGAQLEQQARDYASDKQSDRNFTTVYGLATTTTLLRVVTLALMGVALFGAAGGAIPSTLIPFGGIMLPIAAHRLMRRADQPRSEWLIRAGLAAAIVYSIVMTLNFS